MGGTSFLRLLGLFIGLHFVLVGAAIATLSWFVTNKYLRVQSFHGVEQRMEWMYAFDVHCNVLYAGALCYYLYITSLGYSTLPFLERTEVFLYPMIPVIIVVVILTFFRVNLTSLSITLFAV